MAFYNAPGSTIFKSAGLRYPPKRFAGKDLPILSELSPTVDRIYPDLRVKTRR